MIRTYPRMTKRIVKCLDPVALECLAEFSVLGTGSRGGVAAKADVFSCPYPYGACGASLVAVPVHGFRTLSEFLGYGSHGAVVALVVAYSHYVYLLTVSGTLVIFSANDFVFCCSFMIFSNISEGFV